MNVPVEASHYELNATSHERNVAYVYHDDGNKNKNVLLCYVSLSRPALVQC